MNYEPLKDVRVRRAIALLMDPAELTVARYGSEEFGWRNLALFPPPWNLPEAESAKIMWWDKPFEDRVSRSQETNGGCRLCQWLQAENSSPQSKEL
ncbi:hypothetical protein ACFLUS_00510 [Chloroflexota bacterium]